jgi:hypothetical protein
MKIRLVRTGGVGGMRREAAVDTDRVDADCASRLRALLDSARRAGVFETSSAASGSARDRFRYHLTVEDEHGSREARFTEEAAPESALLLVETVWRASESEPPDGIRTV